MTDEQNLVKACSLGDRYVEYFNNVVAGTSSDGLGNLVDEGIQAGEAYNSTITYNGGDIVSYGGDVYICKAVSTGNLPTNTTYFTKHALSSFGTNPIGMFRITQMYSLESTAIDSTINNGAVSVSAYRDNDAYTSASYTGHVIDIVLANNDQITSGESYNVIFMVRDVSGMEDIILSNNQDSYVAGSDRFHLIKQEKNLLRFRISGKYNTTTDYYLQYFYGVIDIFLYKK